MSQEVEGKRTETPEEALPGLHARVLTFHVEQDHMPTVIETLKASLARLNRISGFKGVLCLEHDGVRNQLLIITLWDADGLASSAQEAQNAVALITDAGDSGVSIRAYEVLGFVPGPEGMPVVVLPEVAGKPLAG